MRDVLACPRCEAFRADKKHECVLLADRVLAISGGLNATTVRGPGRVRFRRTGDFDQRGRCQFQLDWIDAGRPRGQVFFAVPEEHVVLDRAQGET
jgi:hypothetical protein